MLIISIGPTIKKQLWVAKTVSQKLIPLKSCANQTDNFPININNTAVTLAMWVLKCHSYIANTQSEPTVFSVSECGEDREMRQRHPCSGVTL